MPACHRTCALACLILATALCPAQRQPELPPAPTLRQFMQTAGYIFDGTVVSVERLGPDGADRVASVQITFRVNQAFRGARNGDLLTIREWAGLWEAGEHYRVGERVLLLLHRPSRLGLTSPVAGGLGRFSLDRDGEVLLAERLRPLSPGKPMPPALAGRAHVPVREFAGALLRAEQER